MGAPRRILLVEDSADDAELVVRALRRGGCDLSYERVDTPEAMQAALEEGSWDLVIADYSMPRFNGLAALKLLQAKGLDLPFILVSGTVDQDMAVQAMKEGAHDYLFKNNLARLAPAVERELRDVEVRRERRRAEARYRILVDSVPVGVFSITPEGRVLEANPAFIEMLGFEDAEGLKRANIEELWAQPEERARLRALIAREGVVRDFEMRFRRQDGSTVWCSHSARAVYDAAGKVDHYEGISRKVDHYEGVSVDISERRKAQEELNLARDRERDLAIEAARLRADFLANMSHELRTPLSAIIGTAEMLSLSELPPEQRRQTGIIRSSGELLLTIVNDILDLSKLSAGKLMLEKLDLDPIELAEDLIDSFAAAARAKEIELVLQVDVSMPTGLRGDPNRLRQILNNLVSNAIKFTTAGEVLVRATRAQDAASDVLMRFEVIDTGVGIPPEVQRRLFQPFVQAEASTSRRYGGTGLGLAIAAQLTRQMGGEIGFESSLGHGSTFHFTVRLEKGTGIVRPWMKASAASYFKGMHALIVWDSQVGRRVISEYLSSWGIAKLAVARGADALDNLRLAPSRNTVVLLDELISGMSALSLARAIKSDSRLKDTKVIMLSSDSREESSAEDVDSWLTKPIRPSHLFSCLLELFLTPDQAPDASPPAPPSPLDNAQHEWRKGVRVLFVEDNIVNRTMAAQQFAVLGYAAEIVEDARRGLEVVSSGGCDIVLMDCEMPGMDGYQATAEIRRRESNARHTVVIALTAHATEGDRARCLEAGMDDYLSKPVKLQALAEMLDSWARRKPNDGVPSGREAALGQSDKHAEEELDPAALAEIAQLSKDTGSDLLRKLVESFLAELSARVDSIKAAVESNEMSTLACAVHPLRSASAILGAKRFSALCATVEERARAGNTEQAVSVAKDLIEAARRIPEVLTRAASET